jgi:outer membrane lipoprotein SlyB
MSPRIFATLTTVLVLLAGCSKDIASDTYTTSATSGKVLKGTIISTRKVTIKEHDKLQDNTIGGLAGGAGGAVAGDSIGQGSGSIGAAIGGAVLGAVAGAYVQDALGTSEGMEYLVKLDASHARDEGPQHKKKVTEKIDGSVDKEITTSIDTNLQTDMVSVVQKADPALAVGGPVYVIYSSDRPRLAPIPKTAN